MKSNYLKIVILIALLSIGCSERSLYNDPFDPGMGGAFTNIRGEISGILSKDKSPYYVSENISVPTGATLSIEPGTLIYFKINAGFYIQGGLRAIGIKEQPISLQGFGNAWAGIHSDDPTDSLIFVFCNIEEVYLPIESDIRYGGLEVSNANLVVKNCYFYFNYARNGGALSIAYCNSEILNNIFKENECLDYGVAILSQNSSNKIIITIARNLLINYRCMSKLL